MPSLDTAMSYHRLKRAPLDDMEVFTSLRDLMDYCESGARYDGQRVAVLSGGDTGRVTEYTIRNNIPIINMRGSEPIFRSSIEFLYGYKGAGMLIYENNGDNTFLTNDVFCFDEGKLCLLDQLEIFRISKANGEKIFLFYMERIERNTNNIVVSSWAQDYNPYIDGVAKPVQFQYPGAPITAMSFNNVYGGDFGRLLDTDNTSIYLMPTGGDSAEFESNYITRIYVFAAYYHNAWVRCI